MASTAWRRLVRFIPKSSSPPSKIHLGQPLEDIVDVGLAIHRGHDVEVETFTGTSMLQPGHKTGDRRMVGRLLSPLAQEEVGTIRCVGLNAMQYKNHAEETGMALPKRPEIFLKPSTALASPSPPSIPLPRPTLATNTGDYESELAVILGPRPCKNVSADNALDYVLGYTAANDVSCREEQLAGSQWCVSKGFDGACPVGPTLVSPTLMPDPTSLHIKGYLNGELVQDSGVDDLIFPIPQLIAHLSRSTTLPPGTVILTGTPAGVGFTRKPPVRLGAGDEFRVEIGPFIGSLVNRFVDEDAADSGGSV